jgi:lysophospholipase L1-like esterase
MRIALRSSDALWLALPLLAVHCTSSTVAQDGGTADSGSPPASDAAVEAASTDGGRAGDAPTTDAADAAPEAAVCPPSVDAGVNSYTADDPNIQYYGRVDTTNAKQPKFAASAVTVRAKFQGTALSVMFQDENRSGSFNFFDVIVDDLPAVKITPAVGKKLYDATPPGMCDGVHTVTFTKRTEADTGLTTFLGFTFTGTIVPPDPKPTRRIEIIGDSITCGAGVEATSSGAPECSQNGLLDLGNPQAGYGQGVENGYLAFGPVLARALDAEWHVTCASGIGLVRSYYSRGDQRPMPQVYDLLYPENAASAPTWDTSLFKPDVIVVALGTNDFSRDSAPVNGATAYRDSMDPAVLVRQGYVPFINQLATYYPGVTVVLVSSPILGDMYPTATDMQLTQHRTAIAETAAYYAGDGGLPPYQTSPDGGISADGGDGGATSDGAVADAGSPADAGDGGAIAEGGAAVDAGPPNVRVYAAVVDKVTGTGCGGHPSVSQQAAAAAQIETVIRSAMNW